MARDILLSGTGVTKQFDYPPRLSPFELDQLDYAFESINSMIRMAEEWHAGVLEDAGAKSKRFAKKNFIKPRYYEHLKDCIMYGP